ncbi:MAG: hypothetical protein M0Q51_06525 [Bacteroidales bacterium]|nr:hypothetical protein [Bacteroidales bacterium]
MALFKAIEVQGATIPGSKSGSIIRPDKHTFWNRQQKVIADEFDSKEFLVDHSVTFVSDGAWNMHDLVYYLLKRFGSGKVYITTWAISEIAMRQLFIYQKESLITELYMLCDYRNTSRKPAELAFIEKNSTKIKLAKIHAKVTVLMLPSICLSINGSPNYTRNPRLESGTITVSKEVADFHKGWILEQIYNGETQ